jgi:hypothetical protein
MAGTDLGATVHDVACLPTASSASSMPASIRDARGFTARDRNARRLALELVPSVQSF